MNTKWKVITLIMLVFLGFSACFTIVFIGHSRKDLATFVNLSAQGIRSVAIAIQEQTSSQYQARIKSFLRFQTVLSNGEIIQAFVDRDREALLRLSTPYFELFKKENPDFSTFTWIMADNVSFLHLHVPEKSGVDVSQWRPDIVSANQKHCDHSGFAVSPVGMQYRIVSPVSWQGKHVGVLHFGFKDSLFIDAIYEKLHIPVGMVIPSEQFQRIKYSELPAIKGTSFAIQSRQAELFKEDNGSIDWNLDKQEVVLQGKEYILLKVVALNNYNKEPQGHIFAAIDISEYVDATRSYLVSIIIISSILMLFCFLILYFSYGSLAQKIMDFRIVEKVNRKLEHSVAERTRELEENRNYLQTIFNAPHEAIILVAPDSCAIIDVNQAMLRMYGMSLEQALRLRIQDISVNESPYTSDEFREKIEKAGAGEPQVFEWLARKESGEIFWVEVGLTVTEFAEHSHIIAVVRDIDKKKKAEQVVFAEQERIAVTLRSICDGVMTTDVNGKITLLNRVAERLTGWSNKDAWGKESSEIFNIINEQTGEQGESPVQKVLKSGQVIDRTNHTTLIAKDGARKSIADSGAPIKDRQGRIIGVVIIFRDISKEKKIEEDLSKIRRLESLGTLAGGIAHDYNNMLCAIQGNVELAQQYIEEGHQASTLLVNALEATSLATQLTRQLLTFASGGDPVKEIASLSQLVHDTAGFVLHGSHVSCSYDFPEDFWLVEVDREQMSQVIENIIINARDAMPAPGRIEIQGTNVPDAAAEPLPTIHAGKLVKLTIKDTGTGIPEDIVTKIFDPYFSTKKQGNGLGLTICHSIISKHGGHITVESIAGKGTMFTIYLPASLRTEIKQIAPGGKAKIKSAKPARIMVMDDEEMMRKIAGRQLNHLGHDVVLVADGEEAIVRYRELQNTTESIDVIFMDLTIPGGMGGKEAVQEILAINPDAKVIVASGYSNDPVMANYKEYGFIASLEKPYDLTRLSSVLSSVTA